MAGLHPYVAAFLEEVERVLTQMTEPDQVVEANREPPDRKLGITKGGWRSLFNVASLENRPGDSR